MSKTDENVVDMDEMIEGMDVEGIEDVHVLPEGEAQLRIYNADLRTREETGGKYIVLSCESIKDPYAKDVSHTLWLPHGSDDDPQLAKRNARSKQTFKAFYSATGFDGSQPYQVSELVGLTFWALLGLRDDPEYGEQNRIRRFVAGS